jgi:equilibrative nucleoside transporter 1/2/3
MSGQALGGIFAAVANIISILLSADESSSAFIYFLLGSGSLLLSFIIVTFGLPRLIFFKFHAAEGGSIYRFVENYPPQARIRPESGIGKNSQWAVFKKVSSC